MKKSLIIFILFIALFFYGKNANAQQKYKVEYDVEVFWSSAGPSQTYSVDIANSTTDNSGPGIFSGNVDNGPLETYNVMRDLIVESSQIYTGIRRGVRQSGSTSYTYYDFCDIPNNGSWLLGDRGFVGFFNVYRIEDFATANGYSITNNTLSSCLSTTLQVTSNSCGNSRYAVQYQVGGSSTWSTLLAYGNRGSSFTFVQSDFPGLDNYENLRLRIQYNNTSTIEYSDVLTYSYLPCPPTLNNTAPVNVTCFDSNDGGVRLTFDRPLASGEQFRATLSGLTPEGQTIPEADTTADTFGAGNTYDWANNLAAGDYTITFQTFILNGPGSADDTPTSTGETGSFTINRPSAVTVGVSSTTQPSCVGDTGSVTLSSGGGQDLESGTYQYSNNGVAWQASPTFNNLAQGSSNIFSSRLVLSGGRFCVSPTPTAAVNINTITNGLSVTSASVDTSPSYPGASDGAIRINTSGGSPNRTYQVSGPVTTSITNGISSGVVSNLPAGTYSISVTDGNGCSDTFASTVVLSAIPVPNVGTPSISSPISCFGDSNGSITIAISGGTAPYNFEWRLNGTIIETNSTGTSFVRSGLAAGNYSLSVSSNGAPLNIAAATDSESINLSAPTQLAINSAIANDISCFGGNDGGIDVTLSGGTAPYRYRIANTGGYTNASGSSFSIQVTSTGNYPLYIRDANDCQVVFGSTLNISQPTAAISINEIVASHVDNTVNGGSSGILEISVANNNGTASTAWTRDGSAFTPPTGSTNTRLVNLPAGSYNLVFTDTNGCTGSLASPIAISEPGPLGITSITDTDINCNGDTNGTITAVVTGTPPFTYTWERQGDPGFTAPNSPNLTGLPAGTYTLRLTDATPTPEVTDTTTITEPAAAVSGNAIPTDVSCFGGNNGAISISANGGTAGYTYSLNAGAFQTGNTFNGLLPATYDITIRDANGCTFDTTTTINEPAQITVATDAITNATTAGGSDGAIAISIAGGTSPYNITWSGPGSYTSNSEDITGLLAGQYTLQVRDANHSIDASGCYFIQNFTVTEPGPLAIDNVNVTDVDCRGDATGAITITATGNAPIQYIWEFNGIVIPGADTNILTNIGAGVYTITLDDPTANPTVSQNITVGEPADDLTATGVAFDISCFGASDGTIQINALGGTTPYTYSLDGTNFQAANSFTGLSEAFYNATVRDANNCEFILPNAIFVNAPQEMGLLIDEQRDLSAANASDGAISITPFGGTTPYTFAWSSDNGFSSNNEDITALAGGTYTLIITDANYNTIADTGCTYSQTFTISEPGVLLANITQNEFLECYGDDFAELQANVQGGVMPYSYQWFQIVAGNSTALVEDTNTIAGLSAGEYFVRVTDNNAISVDAVSITVIEPGELGITIDNVTDVICLDALTGAIDITVSGGTPPYSYTWDNGATLEDLTGIPAGDYNIEVVDANNCFTDIDITVAAPTNPISLNSAAITDATAYQATDGAITLDISGGTSPINIQWTRDSDGSTIGNTATISDLTADNYTVVITDDNGCNITQTYPVTQPDIVEETITPPICNGDANASIALSVNQGNGSFSYNWSNGATSSEITGLLAGSYTVTITGLPNGDLVRTYEVIDPLPLNVDLGVDRVLCAEQQLVLDPSIEEPNATYQWTSDNGFTSSDALIVITQAGNYSLTLTLPSGCTATGSINVDTIDQEISAEFAVSSQVFTGETLLAVDISYPLPESLTWVLPEQATVLNQDQDQAEIVFDQPGEYEIGILTARGDCIAERYKTIMVIDRDNSVPNDNSRNNTKTITDFIVFPNPTSGKFNAQIELPERGNISIKIFGFANNNLIATETQRGQQSYNIEFDIEGTPPGVYAILLETPFGNQLQKIIIR